MSPHSIRVLEENNQFLVEIPPGLKERARRIPGRVWDQRRVAWKYPRTLACYEALKKEFQRDAGTFDIRKPKRLPIPRPVPATTDDDDSIFETDFKELSEKTSTIHEQFNGLSQQINLLMDGVRIIGESTDGIEKLIKEQPQAEPASASAPQKEDNPRSFNLNSAADLEEIEKPLILIAWASSGQDESFAKWLTIHQPLRRPVQFITHTHEHLHNSLASLVGEPEPRRVRFVDMIKAAREQELIDCGQRHNVAQILFTLNYHRNIIAHPEGNTEAENLNRSITYLFNVAMIWQDFVSEPVDE
ncbi:hypothetical protein JIN77_02655 [Verrucomicrobiaceae bacterium R5-34]|nr:hypothetical protein [Verrucomicrobiaceae bacterium R5-34]